MNRIKFNVEDIVSKFEELIPLNASERDKELTFLSHELRSPYVHILGLADIFTILTKENQSFEQTEYLNNLTNLCELTLSETRNLLVNYRKKTEPEIIQFHQNGIATESKKLISNLSAILNYIPIGDKVKFEGLSEEDRRWVDMFDSKVEEMIEMHNQHFSREYRIHDLEATIKEYTKDYATGLNSSLKIEKLDNTNYISPSNYFKSVILVLKKNIEDHAYNPENDVTKRLTSDFEKKMKMWIEPNPEEKFLTVYFQDNGFGISPSIQDKLFEKGASSKTDTTTEHGIGLWYVKSFVEKRGGKIGYNTEPGQGTTFYFTVPYDWISDKGAYVKD